jgi:hypothetical protein
MEDQCANDLKAPDQENKTSTAADSSHGRHSSKMQWHAPELYQTIVQVIV